MLQGTEELTGDLLNPDLALVGAERLWSQLTPCRQASEIAAVAVNATRSRRELVIEKMPCSVTRSMSDAAAPPLRPAHAFGRASRRRGDHRRRPLRLEIAGDPIALATTERRPAEPPALIATADPAGPTTAEQKVEVQLTAAAGPLTAAALRKLCRVRNAILTAALADLVAAGRVRKDAAGYAIAR